MGRICRAWPFPKDDLLFREYLFAKCWEQGIHRQYGALLLSDRWIPLRDRLNGLWTQPTNGAPQPPPSTLAD